MKYCLATLQIRTVLGPRKMLRVKSYCQILMRFLQALKNFVHLTKHLKQTEPKKKQCYPTLQRTLLCPGMMWKIKCDYQQVSI